MRATAKRYGGAGSRKGAGTNEQPTKREPVAAWLEHRDGSCEPLYRVEWKDEQ